MDKKQFFRYLGLSLSVAFLCLGLNGCSTNEETPYVERPIEELYNEGRAHMTAGRYEKAATSFDEIERQYPYSEWASQAQLMSAYAYYRAQEYEKALVGVESFIALHPSHQDIAYAYYLRGLCYYEQISTVQRDMKVTDMALEAFRELVKKHPHTRYARDARIKIELLRDHLAARQMDVGRYYQRIKAYPAAINRFKEVVLKYQTTSHVEEALHRLVEIFLTLGLPQEARKAAAVLGHNFPGSPWYQETYALMESTGTPLKDAGETPSTWFSSTELQKEKSRAGNEHIDERAVGRDEANYPADLARPVERLGTPEGYAKAKKKLEEEQSSFEKMEDWFRSGSSKESPAVKQDAAGMEKNLMSGN